MATQTTVKPLGISQLTATAAAIYTAPANTTALIKKATVTNPTAGAVSITVYKVSNAGTAGATNTLVSAKAIPPGADVELYSLANHALAPGDFISALASVTASLNLMISGVEIV